MRKKSGHFSVEANNLIYYPHDQNIKIKVKGKWVLDRTHNLIFIVDRSMSERFGETISLRTKIEKAKSNRISFKILKRRTPLHKEIKRIYFDGAWRMDKYHRLKFTFKKDKQSRGLLLRNEWQVTKQNQLIYTYRRTVKKRTVLHAFILNGQWEFNGRILKYRIDGASDSSLNIKISKKKRVCDLKQKRIDFEYGFGYKYADKVRIKKSVFSLFGTWKLYSKTKIGFLISYGKKKNIMWVFPVEVRFRRNRIEIEVKQRKGSAVTGKFSLFRDITPHKEFFLIFHKEPRDISVDTGFRIVF